MKLLTTVLFVVCCAAAQAQYRLATYALPATNPYTVAAKKRLYQQNFGSIVGLQRGNITSIELGAEMHWRKVSLRDPKITGATANFEYNFGHHVLGYKAGMWFKQGRW